MTTRATLDVSGLPPVGFDTRDTTWWGNVLLLGIETTTVALLLATYFYLWQANPEWPPPLVDRRPPLKHPVPDLGAATAVALLLLGSCGSMYWADQAARRTDRRRVWWGLVVQTALGLTAFTLQCFDLRGLHFYWDENAYGSVVWTIVGLHLFYLYAAIIESGSLLVWVSVYGLDESRAVDTTIMGLYWYWTVAIWWVMYAVVYWAPRLIGAGGGSP